MSRTAIAREIGGAESSTTREKDALRNSTSAHQAARAASGGRTTHRPVASRSQSRGASVRDASMNATHSPRATAALMTWRKSVSLPVVPTTSVSRPRGNPPDASARSSASTPVGIPAAGGRGAGNNARRDSTRNAAGAAGAREAREAREARAELTKKRCCRVQAATEETPKMCLEKDNPSTVIR